MRKNLTSLVLLLIIGLAMSFPIAQAQVMNQPDAKPPSQDSPQLIDGQPTFAFTGVFASGCGEVELALNFTYSNMNASVHSQHTIVRSGGLTYMNQLGSFLDGSGIGVWGISFPYSSGGPTNGTYPFPEGQRIDVTVFILEDGQIVGSTHIALDGCDTANIIDDLPIPAVSTVGIVSLGLLLLAFGVLALRRRVT